MPGLPGIYYQQQPPFVGGRQPYKQRKLNPVFMDTAAVVRGGQVWAPLPDPADLFPYATQQRKLPPAFTGTPAPNAPAIMHAGRRHRTMQIIRAWDPPPPEPHQGGRVAQQKRQLNPTVLNVLVQNPPFRHQGRLASTLARIVEAHQPGPPARVYRRFLRTEPGAPPATPGHGRIMFLRRRRR